jgi:hypothetical protein
MSKSNGNRPWGPIVEIPVREIPPRFISDLWAELYDDLVKRLEKTEEPYALQVPFADAKQAESARTSIRKAAKQQERDIAIDSRKTPDGGRILYISRGPNWK